ncbi:MAG TPA: hypothetical protein VMV77_08970 [Bacteroidales bacterium]|nr:hypothetical protein [Bacteroidales bacterium]
MRLQIDTKAKIIRVDENVKFDELIKVLDKLLPKEWKSYTLETNAIIQWYKPIPYYPARPYYDPPGKIGGVAYLTAQVCQGTEEVTGIYNLEIFN